MSATSVPVCRSPAAKLWPGAGSSGDTGKAMAGLVAHVRAGRIAAGSRGLFLHTGGLPAIFAYADKLGPWFSEALWAPAG